MKRTPRKRNPDSSVGRVRSVFCDHPNVILTRRNILDKALQPSFNPEYDEYCLSMAISRMTESGELKSFPLLGKKGYMYFTDAKAL